MEISAPMGHDARMDYIYKAQLVRVIDGDTLDLDIDLGFQVTTRLRCRLYGINTPETHGPKAAVEKVAGLAAVKFVTEWLDGRELRIKSHDGRKIGQEKYGRWLVDVLDTHDKCLNDEILVAGHAKPLIY